MSAIREIDIRGAWDRLFKGAATPDDMVAIDRDLIERDLDLGMLIIASTTESANVEGGLSSEDEDDQKKQKRRERWESYWQSVLAIEGQEQIEAATEAAEGQLGVEIFQGVQQARQRAKGESTEQRAEQLDQVEKAVTKKEAEKPRGLGLEHLLIWIMGREDKVAEIEAEKEHAFAGHTAA